jgi:hypothetical protein
MPEPCIAEAEVANGKFKSCKSPGADQIPAELVQVGGCILSRIIHYTDEINDITGDHQCGFQQNRSTTDQRFYIRQIQERKWQYNGRVHQLFIDFNKAYDSVTTQVLYNILTEFEIPRKLVELIKMCLNEKYDTV